MSRFDCFSKPLFLAATLLAVALATGCSGNRDPILGGGGNNLVSLSSIQVTPAAQTIANGSTKQFTATGIYSDSTTRDLTLSVTWTSSALSVATISNATGTKGLASAVAVGVTTIKAVDPMTLKEGTTTLTVSNAVLTSIAVTPTNSLVSKGMTRQFTAIGTYSDNSTQNLTQSVTWSSSNLPAATISTATGSKGLAMGVAVGVTTIKAVDPVSLKEGTTLLTVTPAVLASLAVTPANPSVAKGRTRPFIAMGTYSDSTTLDLTSYVTWSSSNLPVATISNVAGFKGLATAVAVGVTTIKAVDPATLIEGTTNLTVTAAVLTSIAVTPANPSVPKGMTSPFIAMGTFSDNTTQNLTLSVTWSSSNLPVATISNVTGSKGLATAVAVGITTIRAIDPVTLLEGTTTLSVTPAVLVSLAVTPVNPSVAKGRTNPFVATGTFSDSTTRDLTSYVTWSSSNLPIATISNAPGFQGLATAVAVGTSTIRAIDPVTLIQGTTLLTVTAAVLNSIAVIPVDPIIAKGRTSQFAAIGTYSDATTADITLAVTWSSLSPLVATISNAAGSKGLASAVTTGITTIKAIDPATLKEGTTTLTVSDAALVSIAVTPINPSIAKGRTNQFIATGTFSDATTQNLTSSVTWSSSNLLVATISNAPGSNGLASSVDVGITTIKAVDPLSLLEGSTTLTVTAAVLDFITVTPINPSIAKGKATQFMATGTFSDATTLDLTLSVTWSSSNLLVGTISNALGSNGLAIGVDLGITTIKALDPVSLKEGTTDLTVTDAVLTSIAVTPINKVVGIGATVQYTAIGTFSDATTLDITSSVEWSSSDLAVATISSDTGTDGLATAGIVGVTTIKAVDPVTLVEGSTTLTVSLLGSAATYGVFGGTAGMTNMGTLTIINGDIGTTATTTSSITGFHDTEGDIFTETGSNIGTVNGTIFTCTNSVTGPNSTGVNAAYCAAATQARLDAQTAYGTLVAMAAGGTGPAPPANMAGITVNPGVWDAPSGSFMIQGGDLTLDALGNPNAIFVFRMATSLTVGGPGAAFPQSIILAGGAQAKNVYWQVGSAATINAGGGGTMMGTIISMAGADFSTAGNVDLVILNGRVLSLGASVTLVNTVITVPAP